VAHSAPSSRSTGNGEASIGTLVQSALADMSTLIRAEVELAKSEISKSAKKAGIGAGSFGAAGVVLAFSVFFIGIALAEFITWLGLLRWISYLIVWFLFVLVAGLAAMIGMRFIKRIEKPERTIESLRELPEVIHREAPGQRHREVPTVSNGRVALPSRTDYHV
jgi:membrane protein implicated in regulation of membrane protease activity